MNIFLNRKPYYGPYGGGAKFINSCYELLPNHGIDFKFYGIPDVLVSLGLEAENDCPSAEQLTLIKQKFKTKLIIRVNECDLRKGTNYVDKRLIDISNFVDGTVFVSSWMKDYFLSKNWRCNNNVVIVNGVDEDIFSSQKKLENGKINIVTHHWSDNRLKGADIYEQLDKFVGEHSNEFTLTYIGRHQCNFTNTNVITPLFGKKLGEELGKYDVYVSASRYDPGPNHCSESISCKLPTYAHINGGGAVEFVGTDHVYHDWKELETILLSKQFKRNETKFDRWSVTMENFAQFLKSFIVE